LRTPPAWPHRSISTGPPFVLACRQRVPGADVRRADAELLPWPDKAFQAVLAQLSVNFMDDPATRGIRHRLAENEK
jgi:hypothetical protein